MFFRKSKVSAHPGLRNYMATKLTNNPMTLTPLRVLINTTMSCQPCIFITCPEGGDKVTSHCAITAARDLLMWPGKEEMASVSPIHIWGNWGSEKLMILGHTVTVVKPRFWLRAGWLSHWSSLSWNTGPPIHHITGLDLLWPQLADQGFLPPMGKAAHTHIQNNALYWTTTAKCVRPVTMVGHWEKT